MYTGFVKRLIDISLALLMLIVLLPLLLFITAMIRVKMGSPVLFKQVRPGRKGPDGSEELFTIYKFRSMTDTKDTNGKLLPDEARLTKFGKMLRASSIDELPELINIIKGDMSIVGPRPLLVRDMVFMSQEQRKRHNVRPGLTGWAQVNGRNCIDWEDKLRYDLEYLQHITFINDLRIVLTTVYKVIKTEDINHAGMATTDDFGDSLLQMGAIDYDAYLRKQNDALSIVQSKGLRV